MLVLVNTTLPPLYDIFEQIKLPLVSGPIVLRIKLNSFSYNFPEQGPLSCQRQPLPFETFIESLFTLEVLCPLMLQVLFEKANYGFREKVCAVKSLSCCFIASEWFGPL